MKCSEFLDSMKRHSAMFAPPASAQSISLTNSGLQNIHAAILPQFIIDLYLKCGGINLGNAYIFGPTQISRGKIYPIPSILDINKELINIPKLNGKTVFGRNDLFWFVFDTFGICSMLDNITLNELRKYPDPYKAMTDCLIAGNI